MDEDKTRAITTIQPKRELTKKNWLFVKFYLETGNPQLAYVKAGYKGKSYSSPYEMVSSLRDEIKNIAENSGVGHSSLMIKVKSLIDRKIIRVNKYGGEHIATGLTPSEHLKAMDFARKLSDKKEKDNVQLSPVIIKTEDGGKTQVNIGKPEDQRGPEVREKQGRGDKEEDKEHEESPGNQTD